jgi:hypothetical protein
LDETACSRRLLSALHPRGLHCPDGHELPPNQAPHDRHREPVVNYLGFLQGLFGAFTPNGP